MGIADLERELREQRQRVTHRRERRNDLRRAVREKDRALEDRLARVEELRDDRDRNQEQLVLIRDRIKAVELDGVSEEEAKRHRHLIDRLEEEVDANEELTATIEDVLGRIATAREHKDRLIDLRRRFGNKLDLAIKRREKIERQLREAREDAASNLLGSPYFVVAEFDCRDGTPVPAAAIPGLRDAVNRYLDPLRRSGGPVRINSGYRTRSYNAQIGGASLSVHIYDEHPAAIAADHYQEGRSPAEVQRWHDSNTHPDGMGYYSSFTHIDNRNRIGWPDSRWNGP